MTIVVAFYFIALVLSYFLYKKVSHPVLIFNLLWFILLLASVYGHLEETLGFYKLSPQIYQVFLIGGICYNVGAFLSNFFKPMRGKKKGVIEDTAIFTDKKINLLYYAEIVLLFYYSIKSIVIARLLLTGQSYEAIRRIYFSDQIITSPLESAAVLFIFDPLLYITEIIFAVNLFKHIFPRKINVLMIVNLLLRTFLSGGRTALFVTGCLILVCALYFGFFKKIRLKRAVGLFVALYAILFVTVAVSSQRHGDEGGVLQIAYNNLMEYFTGSFVFFEDLLSNNDFLPISYGLVSFGGITDIFIQLFRYLGLTDAPLIYISTGGILADFRMIGESVSYNAMPTMYYYFYTDFHECGYAVFPFIFGCVSVYIFSKMENNGTLLSFVYYLFLMILIIESSFNWPLSRVSFVVAIFFSVFLLKPINPKRTIQK